MQLGMIAEITFLSILANRLDCKEPFCKSKVNGVQNMPHHYGNSRAMWDHTVLPATRQR